MNKIRKRLGHLGEQMKNDNVAKIALAMLYLGEGAKNMRGALLFGNSDPKIISLYLKGLRQCYNIDESKFRVTVQCRADQDTDYLQKFWLEVTKIPRNQFYKPQIDPRTKGKPTRKLNYKGVCRIDYFSADVYNELTIIVEVINNQFLGNIRGR